MVDIHSATDENRRGKKKKKEEEETTGVKHNRLPIPWAAIKIREEASNKSRPIYVGESIACTSG